jgi:phage/plasmid-like protein (TIGR03299 family)
MNVLTGPVSGEEMLTAAGLDWTVSKQPIFVTGTNARRIPGWNALQRDTDGSVYGLVKDGYRIFQNIEGFDFLEALLSESHPESLSAGSLFGGALCWALLKVGAFNVRGDDSPYNDYLLGLWGHDGRHGFTIASTDVRVVCWNTASAAMGGAKDKITIRHTANMGERVDQARKALDIHDKYVEQLQSILNGLTTRPMSINDVRAYTLELMPDNPKAETPYRAAEERDSIVSLFANSQSLTGVPNTAYRAYQATTEFADHVRTVRTTKTATGDDRRAASIIEGRAASLKSAAIRLLVKA